MLPSSPRDLILFNLTLSALENLLVLPSHTDLQVANKLTNWYSPDSTEGELSNAY